MIEINMQHVRRRLLGLAMISLGLMAVGNLDLALAYFTTSSGLQWLPPTIGLLEIAGGFGLVIEPVSLMFPLFVVPFVVASLIVVLDTLLNSLLFSYTGVVTRILIVLLVWLESFPYGFYSKLKRFISPKSKLSIDKS